MAKTLFQRCVVVALMLFAASGEASAAGNAAANSKAMELLEITGGATTMIQASNTFLDAMVASQKATHPEVPAAFWDAFTEAFKEEEMARTDQILEKLATIYSEHLTDADIDQLILFYKSDLGQKMLRQMPVLLQESLKLGQSWGEEIAQAAALKAAANLLGSPH